MIGIKRKKRLRGLILTIGFVIFKDKTIIDRHKIIYAALDSYIKSGEIHALTIKSLTIDESNKT